MNFPVANRVLRTVTVGNPNVGKSSLINALSGSELQVGNWQGTTVERLEVKMIVAGQEFDVVDLPGAYSLAGATGEEAITRSELIENPPDMIINVVDAGNLERNLAMTLELRELGLPMVVVLNLWDEAVTKGLSIDLPSLSGQLGLPVVATVARGGVGIEELRQALLRPLESTSRLVYPHGIESAMITLQNQLGVSRWLAGAYLSEDLPHIPELARTLREHIETSQDPFLAISETRLIAVAHICNECISGLGRATSLTTRLDSLVLNRWLGLPIFMLGMLMLFRFTFLFSQPWVDCLQTFKHVLAGWISQLPLPPLLISLLNHGILDGVGTVMAFIPVLFLLYLFMGFMESSGFLARTTFIFDRLMAFIGLPGRALIPLLLGFGCNVASIYSTRTLQDPRDRLRVGLAAPFMACSARLTVFILFGTVFFPQGGSTIVFGLYLLGLAVGLATAGLLGLFLPGGEESAGVMELPPYRFPAPSFVARLARRQVECFLKEATLPILMAALLVWTLMSFPRGNVEDSVYASCSSGLQKILRPIGVEDWRLAGALVPGLIAKEVILGTLGVSYLGSQPDQAITLAEGTSQMGMAVLHAGMDTLAVVPQLVGAPSFRAATPVPGDLRAVLSKSMSPPAALAYLVFLLLYTPCVATMAAMKQEFGLRWTLASVVYQLSVAYICAWITYGILR